MSSVTVLVPNYNRAAFLPRALESIRAQTFTNWCVIVGDNASTDQSVEIVRSLDDPRVRLICRPQNLGYIRNTNLLLDEVETEFVAILHSDDWWERDFLEQLVGLLDATPAAVMAVSAVRRVSGSDTVTVDRFETGHPGETAVLSSAEATSVLVQRWPFLTPSDVVARTEVYRRVAGFEESLPCSTDWLMWLRLASAGSVALCQRPLVNNRKHQSSVTGEAEADVRWADEWIRLSQILEAEWARGAQYTGVATELRATNAVRFVMKAYELHERGNRAGALKLARLARQTAPSVRWRAAAAFEHLVIRSTNATTARRLRQLAAGLARRFANSIQPPAKTYASRSPVLQLLTALRESR